MLIGQAAFFRQFPQPFDEVKIWTVWGEEKQLDPEGLCMFFDKVAALVACIVHDQSDFVIGIFRVYFFQQLNDGMWVYVLCGTDADEFLIMTVDCT